MGNIPRCKQAQLSDPEIFLKMFCLASKLEDLLNYAAWLMLRDAMRRNPIIGFPDLKLFAKCPFAMPATATVDIFKYFL